MRDHLPQILSIGLSLVALAVACWVLWRTRQEDKQLQELEGRLTLEEFLEGEGTCTACVPCLARLWSWRHLHGPIGKVDLAPMVYPKGECPDHIGEPAVADGGAVRRLDTTREG